MKNLVSLLMFLAFIGLSEASAEALPAKSILKPFTTKEVLRDANGSEFQVSLTKYTNHNDELEVRVEAAGIPRFASKINPVLGFGRDIDDNGKIDTWFLVTKSGMDLVRLEGNDTFGKDILGDILLKKYRSSLSMYATTAATSLLSYLFMSASEGQNVMEEYYRDWMDLEESRIHFEDTPSTYAQIQFHNELISLGYKELANRMENFGKKSFYGYVFADLGLWITGGVVVNWGAKILAKLGVIASETAFVTTIKETFFSFFEKQKMLIDNKLSSLKDGLRLTKTKVGMKTATAEVTAALTVATWKKVLATTIKSQKTKNKILRYVAKTIKYPKAVYNGAKSEWKYIAMNSTVQIGSEAFARYDEIYDENPAQMAKNLFTNPEVIQNVSFMASETILMTGISKSLKTTKARFMASGAVALTNSSFTNFVLKDEANINRVGFDTAWEVVIGNAQVQLDLKALEYFEKLAQKKNNPKIKLVGYVVALVDMGVGYVTYSKVSSMVENKAKTEEPKVVLVPILAHE